MACRLFAAKPLSKPMLVYCHLDLREQTSVKFLFKNIFFIYENAFEYIVCEMTANLCRRGRGAVDGGRWCGGELNDFLGL